MYQIKQDLTMPVDDILTLLGLEKHQVYTTEEAGAVLAAMNPDRSNPYSKITVSRWCRDGRIPGARNLSRDWAIPRQALYDLADGFHFPKVGRPSKEDAGE